LLREKGTTVNAASQKISSYAGLGTWLPWDGVAWRWRARRVAGNILRTLHHGVSCFILTTTLKTNLRKLCFLKTYFDQSLYMTLELYEHCYHQVAVKVVFWVPYRNSDPGVGFSEFLTQTFSQGTHCMFSGSVKVEWAIQVHHVSQGTV
jgi:hypothetical protein